MELKDSRTYQNLLKAFQGESLASTKYRLYAGKARMDGFEQIGNIFDETAGNEQEHAEIWWKVLSLGEVPYTLENLLDARKGEAYEWSQMYKQFAEEAEEEGFTDIAKLFRGVGSIEKHHDYRFTQLAKNIEDEKVFCKDEQEVWLCLNCGNIYYGSCAPELCPVCKYPQAFYQINCENY